MTRSESVGMGASILSSILAGTAAVATRWVIADIGWFTLALFRCFVGASCLLLFLTMLGSTRVATRDRIPIALLGTLYFALFPVLFNLSLTFTTAARGALALSTAPLLTLVLAAIVGAETVTWQKGLGVSLAMAGVVVALGGSISTTTASQWIGDAVMVLTAVCSAFYSVFSRPYLKRYPALQFTAYAMTVGAVALGIGTGLFGDVHSAERLASSEWAVVGYLSLICTPGVFVLWTYGLKHSTPTRVAVTGAVNPITAVVLAALVLGEHIATSLVVGLCVVVAGIVCTTLDTRASVDSPATVGAD